LGELRITHESRLMRRHKGSLLRMTTRLRSEYAEQQRDHEYDEENVEQDLCNFGRTRRNAGKAEHGGDDRNHEKDNGIVKHGDSPSCCICVALAYDVDWRTVLEASKARFATASFEQR
jgi:hypothetical protein